MEIFFTPPPSCSAALLGGGQPRYSAVPGSFGHLSRRSGTPSASVSESGHPLSSRSPFTKGQTSWPFGTPSPSSSRSGHCRGECCWPGAQGSGRGGGGGGGGAAGGGGGGGGLAGSISSAKPSRARYCGVPGDSPKPGPASANSSACPNA